ncbi:tetratricopeptide repeat protein [Desulfovibrio sp. ZJ369]|uniref:tetratricopeptide repeat protein n=1 Tax=Desulfovibrio sp. ZJ369 TaxID=2709793 RepID=UPI0013EC260C|nr:tetratricopeptide repeat protein [Desulfovibrio sp. ZJ369]
MNRPHSAARKSTLRQSLHRLLPSACLFFSLCLLWLASPQPARAMLWQWLPGASSERLIIVLDSPGQARSVARTSPAGMTLFLNSPAISLRHTGLPPAPGSLLESLALENGQVRINLSSRAVNHVLTRPARDRVEMEFFAAAAEPEAVPVQARGASEPATASAPSTLLSPASGPAAADAGESPALAGDFPADMLRQSLNRAGALPYSRLKALAARQAALQTPEPERRAAEEVMRPAPSGAGFWLSAAYAAAAPDPQESAALGERGRMLTRQDLRGKVNPGGPEDWPQESGLSTATTATVPPSSKEHPASAPLADQTAAAPDTPKAPAPADQAATVADQAPAPPEAPQSVESAESGKPGEMSATQAETAQNKVADSLEGNAEKAAAPQTQAPAEKEEGPVVTGPVDTEPVGLPVDKQPAEETEVSDAKPREVIYVDEQGNPVPKPPEPDKMLAEAERLISEGKYAEALPQLEKIRAITDISPQMREKVLYDISDCLWALYAANPLAGYEAIVSSTNEAMNANLRSPRVPDALLRLGLANADVGNLVDAGGYVVALFRRYPDFPGVAQGFAALGREQLKRGLNPEAEQSFAIVLDKYPESSHLQDASVGLAQALFNQKKYDKAQIILDFISKRWPRHYIDHPDFLLLQAGNDEALQKTDAALALYWLYVNLDPGRKGNDALLLKMGDMYLRKGNMSAANFVYHELERRFAGAPSAFVARLRLAEKGIYQSPLAYEQMSRVFARTGEPPLPQVYNEIAASSKTAPEAVLARLKQAMWLYWDKEYTEAMGKAADFIDGYPEHPDVPQAREIIWQAFQKELANSLAEQNYGRILILWNGFPLVRERYGPPDPRLRYALAQGWLERGEEARAYEMLAEFLKTPMDPEYGEAAFTEFFNRYLQAGAWDKILDLGKLVSAWKMKPELRRQLDYALALSAQNLNLAGPALAMWRELAARADMPLYQRAYATYFLARDAEQRKDIKNAYDFNRQVIDLFTRLQDERSDKADPQRIKEAVAALMDICEVGNRIPEALQWVARYNAFVPETSPEYPGLRFREARLYRKLGDTARAQALLEGVAKQFPDSPFGKAAASELRTFEVSRDLRDYMPGGTRAPQAPAP